MCCKSIKGFFGQHARYIVHSDIIILLCQDGSQLMIHLGGGVQQSSNALDHLIIKIKQTADIQDTGITACIARGNVLHFGQPAMYPLLITQVTSDSSLVDSSGRGRRGLWGNEG